MGVGAISDLCGFSISAAQRLGIACSGISARPSAHLVIA